MKKRLLALFINLTLITTAFPVYAAEDVPIIPSSEECTMDYSREEDSEEIVVADDEWNTEDNFSDADISFEDEDVTGSVEATAEATDQENTLEESYDGTTDAMADWLERHNMYINADGMYEYVDEDGNVWTYDPEDPELFRFFSDDEEYQEIDLNQAYDVDDYADFTDSGNPDPYVFKLDTSKKYRYPSYHAAKRPDVHYGMDISKHQGTVSYNSFVTLKNTYGIDFVFIRAGFRGYGSAGNMKDDECFKGNIENALKAGLRVGVYFFSQAITEQEGIEEADRCMSIIAPYKDQIKLPVIIDYEYSGDANTAGRLANAKLSPAQHTAIVNAFCKKVAASGYYAGIYANKSMLTQDMNLVGIPSEYYIWMANYANPDSNGVCATSYSGRLDAWQFTSKFTGFGTKGKKLIGSENLDLNFWYGNFPSKMSLTYMANGGIGKMSVVKGKGDGECTVAECGYKRSGYDFLNWNTKADGKGDTYRPGDTFRMQEGENYLYAQWTPVTYTVSFVSNGGSAVSSQSKLHYGDKVKEPAIPSYPDEDYIFDGWYKDSTLMIPWDFAKDTIVHDTILYAKWILKYDGAEEITVKGVEDVYYTGSAVTFENLKVFFGKRELKIGQECTVKYAKNVKAGVATVTVTGKGNFSGTKTETFTIKPLDLSESGRVNAPKIRLKYNGKVQKGTTTVAYLRPDGSELVLKAGTDFTFDYPGTVKKTPDYDPTAFVGKADEDTSFIVRIVGKGNFTGETSVEEIIIKKDIDKILTKVPVSKLKVDAVKAQYLSMDDEGNILPVTPGLVVKDGKNLLVELSEDEVNNGYDGYTLSYVNNSAAGNAYIYLTGYGKYYGTRKISFKINPYAISKASVSNWKELQTKFIFNGKAQTLSGYELSFTPAKGQPSVSLKEGVDYTVTYANNVKAGNKATIIFKGKGIYSGELKKTFTITPVEIYSEDVSLGLEGSNSETVYTKGATTPAVQIVLRNSDEEYYLKPGTDYTVKYSNNTAVNDGTNQKKLPSAVITGKGNFKGTKTIFFKINKSDIAGAKMTASAIVYANKANICKPQLQLVDTNGVKLAAGTDYDKKVDYKVVTAKNADGSVKSVTYYDPTKVYEPGTEILVTVTGKGSYYGTKSTVTAYAKADISKAAVVINDQFYTGNQITISKKDIASVKVGKVTLSEDDYDIDVTSYSNNVNCGTASVTIRGKGNYGGSKVATFKIKSRNLKK